MSHWGNICKSTFTLNCSEHIKTEDHCYYMFKSLLNDCVCVYRVGVDDLLYRNVDDRLTQSHHVRVFIDIELLLKFRDVTSWLEKHPEIARISSGQGLSNQSLGKRRIGLNILEFMHKNRNNMNPFTRISLHRGTLSPKCWHFYISSTKTHSPSFTRIPPPSPPGNKCCDAKKNSSNDNKKTLSLCHWKN